MINTDEWLWLSAKELSEKTEWWNIYEDSFPSTERDSTHQLLNAVEKKLAIAGAYKIQEKIAAILVCYHIGKPQFIFLNYIAVAQSMRNLGIGFKIFTSFLKQVQSKIMPFSLQNFAMIWEVEDPGKTENPNDRVLRERRIKFYDRVGGKFLNNRFIQPAIDGLNAIPMRLMYYHLNSQYNIHTVEKKIIRTIYFEKYQKINEIQTDLIENFCDTIFY